jgi:hypothetical protein
MNLSPQWKYLKHDITINFQDIHRLAVKAGTRVERVGTGFGSRYVVHRHDVTLLTETQALFDHDSTYRYIWVDDYDLTDEAPNVQAT